MNPSRRTETKSSVNRLEYLGWFFAMERYKACALCAVNGGRPAVSSNASTPSAHQSTALASYPRVSTR